MVRQEKKVNLAFRVRKGQREKEGQLDQVEEPGLKENLET